jgi:hypothetical protein
MLMQTRKKQMLKLFKKNIDISFVFVLNDKKFVIVSKNFKLLVKK